MSGVQNEGDCRNRSKNLDLPQPYSMGLADDDYNNGRDEKPSERVPGQFIVVLLCVYVLLGYLTQMVEDNMPRVINDRDVPRDSTDMFSEETAWRYLQQIMGDQPRVAGIEYHLTKTKDMKALVDTIAGSAYQTVKTDWQVATGDYYRSQLRSSFLNCYENASNVVAVLEGESGFLSDGSTSTSVLINCHYDSVPFALGASDDAVFCAVMAETLGRLSRRRKKFKNNIVFLFNGAEENGLQASHGFLQHPWSKGITSVVNLDAAGMNGKATIFQVRDPRVLNAYKRSVSRPTAQSFAEFLFDSNVIPSDTDFRIWRDFGHFQGIDVAFSKWGHVYHTRYDHPDLLKPGVMQCAGDTLMSLITELGDMEELKEKATPKTAVYFDYLNLFLINYSLEASYAVDLLVVILGILSVVYYVRLVGLRKSTVHELLYAALGRLVSMAAGGLVTAACVLVMVATTSQLRYFTQPWIVVPLYWMPYLVTAVATSHAYDFWRTGKSGLNRWITCLQAMAATRLLLTLGLVLTMCVPQLVTTRYLLSVPLCITSAMSLITLTLHRYAKLYAWQYLVIQVILSVPSTMFMFMLSLRLDAMMLPIMGRLPIDTPDYTVGSMNVGLVIVASATISGIELLFSKRRLWMALTAVGAISVVIMFIPFSPYSDDGPATQRHYWFHSDISTYNNMSERIDRTHGVLVNKLDAYTSERVLANLPPSLSYALPPHPACGSQVYCNVPLFRTSAARQLKNSLFVYMDPPDPFKPAAETRLLGRNCVANTCTYSFLMIGTAHNLLTIWPRENVNITSWTFSSAPKPSFTQNERPVYVIVHSVATYSGSFEPVAFNVTMTVPLYLQSGPVVDLSHHAHKIHHPEEFTAQYRQLVDSMPAYFNIASFMSFRNNYVF